MPLLGKGNKFKVDPPKIRIERVAVERPTTPKPKPKPQGVTKNSSASRSSSTPRASPKPIQRQKSNSPYPSSSDEKRLERKRKVATPVQRRSPGTDRIAFDKDSDAEDDGWLSLDTRKRQRKSTEDGDLTDPNRKLRHVEAFEEPEANLKFIHAADVASIESKCVPVMGGSKDDVAIEIQYPSPQPREK